MKVMQVLYSGLGGHGSVVTSLIEADRQKEWEHCLLFYGIEDLLPAYQGFCTEKNIAFSYVQKKKGFFHSGWKSVRSEFAKHVPDIIILHSPNLIFPAWQYCRSRKKKLFVVEHTPHATKGIGEKIATAFSLLLAKKTVCLSREYQLRLQSQFRLLPVQRKTVVIPNGIDLEVFRPKEKPVSPELNVGMIGRFSSQKNQAMIIDAIQSGLKEKPIQFHFAGAGETMAVLMKKVQDFGLESQVHFHGLLDEKGIQDLLATLDVYIHASYAETMCTSVMQAMACGLPVLASDIPGINNITEAGKNAFLFKNDDIPALLSGLQQLQDTGIRTQMGVNARQYAVKHFSSLTTFRRYQLLIIEE